MINTKGFTLIEIMVVVVILGILASVIVPRIMSRPDEAKMVKTKHDILTIETALDLYRLDNGYYPSSDQGLEALTIEPSTEPRPRNWKSGGYLKSVPLDPWGAPYRYQNPGDMSEIDIFSYGSDNKPGGEGIDTDVGNWVRIDRDRS